MGGHFKCECEVRQREFENFFFLFFASSKELYRVEWRGVEWRGVEWSRVEGWPMWSVCNEVNGEEKSGEVQTECGEQNRKEQKEEEENEEERGKRKKGGGKGK